MPHQEDYDWLDCPVHGWVMRKDAIENGDETGSLVYQCPVQMQGIEDYYSYPCFERLSERPDQRKVEVNDGNRNANRLV